MDNPMRKIIYGEWWAIRETTHENGYFHAVINTHQREENPSGNTEPTTIKKFIKMDEAINFLEEKFNESRNKNKK